MRPARRLLAALLLGSAGAVGAEALVNDPAADATTQDTQSGASVLPIPPSTVLVVFNDSGSFAGARHRYHICQSMLPYRLELPKTSPSGILRWKLPGPLPSCRDAPQWRPMDA